MDQRVKPVEPSRITAGFVGVHQEIEMITDACETLDRFLRKFSWRFGTKGLPDESREGFPARNGIEYYRNGSEGHGPDYLIGG